MSRDSFHAHPVCAGAIALLALAAAMPQTAVAAADPMRPLSAPAAAAFAPRAPAAARDASPSTPALPALVAIREDAPGQRMALIGERWLAPGDPLGTRRVTAVGFNHVELSDGRRHTRVYLLPPLQPAGEAGSAVSRRGSAAPTARQP